MMERYHDFTLDSCLVDGVSIAETLLYKDADELRTPDFVVDGSLMCDGANVGTVSIAPTNAVAAAAFGSAYSRTASGGLEEVMDPRDVQASENGDMNDEQSSSNNSVTTIFPGSNVTATHCDNNYSKWNELVNKLVDSQEDIPSLLIESANNRNNSVSGTTVNNANTLRVSHLSDISSLNINNTNSASSNSSSNESGVGMVSDSNSNVEHNVVTSRVMASSVAKSEYNKQNSLFTGMAADSNWITTSDIDLVNSAGLSDMNTSAARGSSLQFSRGDMKWSNSQYLLGSVCGSSSTGLHRVNTDPELRGSSPTINRSSTGINTISRLRPIVGKCTDEMSSLMSVVPSSSSACSGSNLGGLSSMTSLASQNSGSHLLPLLRATSSDMIDSVNTSTPPATSTTVSSLLAATACVHTFSSSSGSCVGVATSGNSTNSGFSSTTTPIYHLTADSLRLASRSQLNPNAEKFVFIPPNSNSSSSTCSSNSMSVQQQSQPSQPPQPQPQSSQPQPQQQQHYPFHLSHQHQQTHHTMQPQHQQTPYSSGPSYFTVPSQGTYGTSVISQANVSLCSSSTGNGTGFVMSNGGSNSGNCCGGNTVCGTNVTCSAASSSMASGPSPLPHHLLSLGTISPVTFNFQTKFNTLAEQRKSLDRERNRIEAELCRQYPGKRITSGVCGTSVPPAVKSCNSSDRVDRELNAVLGNHARVVALIAKMEKLQNGGDPLPSHVHSTMECWLEGIRKCQARRKEELVNMTNRQRSGPRQQDEKDVVALTLALAELTEHMRRARTALWAALQMTHKDRASSARDAFRFLEHVRRHGLMVLIPPHTPSTTSSMSLRASAYPSNSNSNGACGDGTTASVSPSIIAATHPLLSVQ